MVGGAEKYLLTRVKLMVFVFTAVETFKGQ